MKKSIIIIVAVLFSTLALSARPTGFNIGGGASYLGWATKSGISPVDYLGSYVEVGYDLQVAKNSYIYFGGRYSHGINIQDAKSLVGGNGYYHYGIGDLFVPIRFQQNFMVGTNTSIYIEAGPALGLLLYNYRTLTTSNSTSYGTRWEDLTYSGEPRVNCYFGGNVGVNIRKHVKIYLGGDYGVAKFTTTTFSGNRWQLNLGACYVF